jgi:inosine-uridine nucleoside N-ribohydrolase
MLEPPKGKVDVIIDSDAFNEFDDQYALVYALKSTDKLNIKAIYAAPYLNSRSVSAEDGMQKSYEEILRILDFMDIPNKNMAYKGSNKFLVDGNTSVESDAALHLVNFAKSYTKENPLYVLALGAITNIASAILLDPSITSKIVVVWLGGNGYNWPTASEFNCEQDIHATRIIFDSGVPFVQITVMPVITHLTTTIPEMEYHLAGKGELAEYLWKILKQYHPERQVPGFSKIVWDIAGVAWFINPNWIPTEIRTSPIITDNWTYSFSPKRHLIRSAYYAERNLIYGDFFNKIMN